jgi:HEAT repeat protein
MPQERDPELTGRLTSDDNGTRMEALDAVAAERDSAYLPHVVASLYYFEPAVRRKAATALRGIKDRRVGDIALLALATEKDPEVIFDLVMVFLYHPREEAVDELLFYLDYPDYRVRSAVVDVLGALGSVYSRRDVVEPLLRLLGDSRPSVVMVTLRALVHMAEALTDKEILETIVKSTAELCDDPNRMVSDLAVTANSQVKDNVIMLEES